MLAIIQSRDTNFKYFTCNTIFNIFTVYLVPWKPSEHLSLYIVSVFTQWILWAESLYIRYAYNVLEGKKFDHGLLELEKNWVLLSIFKK